MWWPFGSDKLDLGDNAFIAFKANGKTIRVDPFEVIEDLVNIDIKHDREDGSEMTRDFLNDVAEYVQEKFSVSKISCYGAMGFYRGVVNAYVEMSEDIQKKTSSYVASPTGTELTQANGHPRSGGRGSRI